MFKINRRTFLKSSAFGWPLAQAALTSNCSQSTEDISTQDLFALFQHPSNIHRPFVRWWWNGLRISHDEILRELDLLQQAGIGGVEINSIKFPETADPMGIKECEWLSDEWLGYLHTALQGARDRDMVCDIIVGSGWPFGGEFLRKDEQTQMMALGTRNVKGPADLRIPRQALLDEIQPVVYAKPEKSYKELAALRLAPAFMDSFTPGINFDSQLDKEVIEIHVPEGDHVLYFLVKLTGYMGVILGAPGAKGPVLNHFNSQAVRSYLQRMSDRINAKIGKPGNHIRAFFTDSIELEGTNWCDDMLEQFEKRRGYSMKPYLPFILFKVGEMGNALPEIYGSKFSTETDEIIQRVRYDFCITRIELFKERFSDTFRTWCHEQGTLARQQGYGMEYHPLDASLTIDIPEGEAWMQPGTGIDMADRRAREGRAYIIDNKSVSSAVRLTGRKLMSCEEITNPYMCFNDSLEKIKVAGDQSNLSGVTHSVLHGFNYSPKEALFPGWVRYGAFINERNPWWSHFRKWTDYKARLSAIFQNAELQANIAVMLPFADLWRKYSTQRDPFPITFEPTFQYNVWESIHQCGNGCDYLSETVLQHARFENGMIKYGNRAYHTLLLVEMESMEAETALALQRFANAGGRIIFIGKEPHRIAGFFQHDEKSKQVALTISAIRRDYPNRVILYPAPSGSVLAWYKELQSRYDLQPYVRFAQPEIMISQIYYRHGDMDIFFIINSSLEKTVRQRIEFSVKGKTPWLWNAETGSRYIYPHEGDGHVLELELVPAGSALIVYAPENSGEPYPRLPAEGTSKPLNGSWQVDLYYPDNSHKRISLNRLIDFLQRPDLKSFGGKAVYRLKFTIEQTKPFHFLELGKVYEISEVKLNNQSLGVRWYGRHLYELSGALKSGDNELEITVIKVLGNYCKLLTGNAAAQYWTNGMDQPFYPSGLVGPVRLL
jgi:hypothetical protein